MLNESLFLESYELAQQARNQGDVANAREILFLLFDRGRHVAGCGVVRLTFVLDDLAELARVRDRYRDAEAQQTLERLRGQRDERERSARDGEAAFVELQELVALNRVLGEGQRSAELLHRLRQENGHGDGQRAVVLHTLEGLVEDEEATPWDAERLVQTIFHHRLRGQLASFTRTVHEFLACSPGEGMHGDGRRQGGDPQVLAALASRLEEVAGEVRRSAGRFHDPDAGTVGRLRPEVHPEVREQVEELARDAFLLLGRSPLRVRLQEAAAGRPEPAALGREVARLEELAREARILSTRHGLDEDREHGRQLEHRLLRMAGDVAGSIAEHRIWEDFLRECKPARTRLEGDLERDIRSRGLLVFEVFLRLDQEERAERMANWLLAFRQNVEMYDELIAIVRRSHHPDLEHRLTAEAQRLHGS